MYCPYSPASVPELTIALVVLMSSQPPDRENQSPIGHPYRVKPDLPPALDRVIHVVDEPTPGAAADAVAGAVAHLQGATAGQVTSPPLR